MTIEELNKRVEELERRIELLIQIGELQNNMNYQLIMKDKLNKIKGKEANNYGNIGNDAK